MPLDEIAFNAEDKMEKAVAFLASEFRGVRTGRATTGLVEHLKIDYYGESTPLQQLAALSAPEASLVVIKPFDPTCIKEIERAILASELGITPQSDKQVIRLVVPPLSGERRGQLAHQVKHLSEEARVSIRNIRRDANKHIDQEQKSKAATEDEADKAKDQIQTLTKKYEDKVGEALKTKLAEIEST